MLGTEQAVPWTDFHKNLIGVWDIGGTLFIINSCVHSWSIDDDSLTPKSPEHTLTVSVLRKDPYLDLTNPDPPADYLNLMDPDLEHSLIGSKSLMAASHGSGADTNPVSYLNWDGRHEEGYYWTSPPGFPNSNPVLGASMTQNDSLSLIANVSNPDEIPRTVRLSVYLLNGAAEVVEGFEDPIVFKDFKIDARRSTVDVPLLGSSTDCYPCISPNNEANDSNDKEDDGDGLIDENIEPVPFPLSQLDDDGQYQIECRLEYQGITVDSVRFRFLVGPVITSDGGTVGLPDGSVSVFFPPDAIPDEVFVSIVKMAEASVPPPPEGWLPVGDMYDFTAFDADGDPVTNFGVDLTITLKYDPADLDGLDEGSLTIFYYGSWISLPSTVDTVAHTVTAETDHFSLFGIFGIPEPSTLLLFGAGLLGILVLVPVRRALKKKQ